MTPERKTDTIPRVRLSYVRAALEGVSRDQTFDEIREAIVGVAETSSGPNRAGGYRAAYRPRDLYSGWTNTREALDEAMRLRVVQSTPLPRRRELVDGHRNHRYELTDLGNSLLNGNRSPADLLESIFALMYERHSHLREVLSVLDRQALLIPEFNLNQISEVDKTMFARVAMEAARRIEAASIVPPDPNQIERQLKEYFSQRQKDLPMINKIQLVDFINYGLQATVLAHYGLQFDHVTFDTIISWGQNELFLCNSSRYVPGLQGWLIYSTAAISSDPPESVKMVRHGRHDYQARIVDAIAEQVRKLRGHNPFVPIYKIQAAVCYQLRINDALFEMVLRDVYLGALEAPYKMHLDPAPPSGLPSAIRDSPLVIERGRYYVMTLFEEKEE